MSSTTLECWPSWYLSFKLVLRLGLGWDWVRVSVAHVLAPVFIGFLRAEVLGLSGKWTISRRLHRIVIFHAVVIVVKDGEPALSLNNPRNPIALISRT